ncbi:MAG: WYL domain-containing protein [Selenomonadaceae bacterium]|nr:WYL domain-containing protein [Selenomonadaceae bacterium]
MADNFIKHILMVESLRQSSQEAPKTARQIQGEVEREWKKIFPNEPADKPMSLLTIHRQVKAIRASGLYQIMNHEDNKRGYYNAEHLLSTAEAAILGAAVYQMASLTIEEKNRILSRLKSATDTDGGSIIYSFERQIRLEDKPNRRQQPSLPKIKSICRAIVEGKTINFYLRQDSAIDDGQNVTALPEFIIRKGDELYLVARVDGLQKDFKIALMSNIEIRDEEFQTEKNFSLRRHLSGSAEDTPPIDLKLSFPESFIENVVERFGLNRIKSLAPNGRVEGGENQFRVTVRIGESEGLYRWLRQNCNKVKVNYPDGVRDNLKEQLSRALGRL